jgi:hypothetical protein
MAIQLSSAKISQAHLLNHVVKDHCSSARTFSFRLSKSNCYRLLLQPNHNILYQFFIFDTRSCVSRSAVACREGEVYPPKVSSQCRGPDFLEKDFDTHSRTLVPTVHRTLLVQPAVQ